MVLQNDGFIANCNGDYKVRWLLQIVTVRGVYFDQPERLSGWDTWTFVTWMQYCTINFRIYDFD